MIVEVNRLREAPVTVGRAVFGMALLCIAALFIAACQDEPTDIGRVSPPEASPSGAQMGQRIDRNYPPLIAAILADDAKAVRAALVAGADPSQPVQQVTPLGWALDGFRCSPEVVRVLAKAGADLNAPIWPSQESPLHLALGLTSRECVEVLLESGADIFKLDRLGGTSIHAAAHGAMLDMVNLFADRGVDVNVVSTTGWTAMMFAALNGDEPMIRRMLELGADPCVREPDGNTAADFARGMGLAKLSRELQEICKRRGKDR